MTAPAARLPSLRGRLARVLVAASLAWGLAVAAVVWALVRHEVDEFMDASLREAAEILHGVLQPQAAALPLDGDGGAMPAPPHRERLLWQLVRADGRVLLRSHRAPAQPLAEAPRRGFGRSADGWRLYTMPLQSPRDGALALVVAQDPKERDGARLEASLVVVGAATAVGLACALALAIGVGRQLRPLAALSAAVARFDPLTPGAALPPAGLRELAPMHDAIESLAARLARRVANERAFSAHAAHALRTPLAGLDVQLAVALREAPEALRTRLERSREAVGRLQRVVAALLTLFRAGGEPAREPMVLAELLPQLPFDGLALVGDDDTPLDADPDLLAAALLNLLDNARRHGARQVTVRVEPAGDGAQRIVVQDDGRGMPAAERERLAAALQAQQYDALPGLGLMLADLVARAHGGALELPAPDGGAPTGTAPSGCRIVLRLATAAPSRPAA